MNAIDAFRRFSLSVDIINDNNKQQINRILENISKNIIGASFFEVQFRTKNNKTKNEFLTTIWSNKQDAIGQVFNVRDLDNRLRGQTGYTLERNIKLWIVDEDGGILNEKSNCIDLWSNTDDFPDYWNYLEDMDYRTSIILPLKHVGTHDPIGIVNFEFEDYYKPNPNFKNVFENLSKSITTLLYAYQARHHQSNNTKSAVDEILTLTRKEQYILKKPEIFVAYSSRGLHDVIEIIKEIETEYENKFKFIWWDKISLTGNIDSQLIKAIMGCKLAIIYFSEPKECGGFVDNPNVVFEAGMFHTLSNNDITTEPVYWIPIREQDDSKIPFDFARERIINVQRDKDKSLFSNKLKFAIEQRLKGIRK
ncbi:hypothetical protein [uncultured Aquimarina sp.]|uniref:hypothetical protein n=1 Tax=uncultured Aquimarina sp. TaxID=575652 RepID=UPI00261D2E02|nr:hypothetical protein [uncultured Aquimarina sp.]